MAMANPKKAAVIDMGTNTFHLLLVELHGKEFKTIYKEKIAVKLGQGGITNNQITPEAETRALHTLGHFKNLIDGEAISQVFAFATSAVRNATNGPDFVNKVKEQLGIQIHVISGEEEAALIFGTFFLLDFDKYISFIVIDVGGWSTEVSVFEKGERVASKSFEIGTIRLLKDKVNENIWKDIHSWIANHVDLETVHQIFATGGNINKVHKMIGKSQSQVLDKNAIVKLRDKLDKLTLEERTDKYQLKPDRADVIVPAMDIYLYILNELNCTQITVPKIGLSKSNW